LKSQYPEKYIFVYEIVEILHPIVFTNKLTCDKADKAFSI